MARKRGAVMIDCDWLPPLICQTDYSDWSAYENALFAQFEADFILDPPKIKSFEFRLSVFHLFAEDMRPFGI